MTINSILNRLLNPAEALAGGEQTHLPSELAPAAAPHGIQHSVTTHLCLSPATTTFSPGYDPPGALQDLLAGCCWYTFNSWCTFNFCDMLR